MPLVVKDIEKAILQLPQDQLQRFRTWYEKFDADNWDEQIADDVSKGRLDDLARIALDDHQAGRSKKL